MAEDDGYLKLYLGDHSNYWMALLTLISSKVILFAGSLMSIFVTKSRTSGDISGAGGELVEVGGNSRGCVLIFE